MAGRTDLEQLVYTISANITTMQKQLDRAVSDNDNAAGKIENRWKRASAPKIDLGGALTSVIDNTRLKILDSGIARVGLFGGALEKLGPVGLAAAAAVGAFAFSLDQAHKAVEFADNIYKLAKNAHVTTDELQAMQFALAAAGGDGKLAAEGLQAFNIRLGEAQAGMPRALRAFRELFGNAFTAADVKRLGDSQAALLAVTAQIEKLKSPAQKDAIVEQLGLTSMKPLIEGGVDKMREFLRTAQEAGVIMDAGLVKKGHELNEQLETLHTKIDVQLKSAFIELGPVLVMLLGLLANMAQVAAEIVDSFHRIENRRVETLAAQRQQALDQAAHAPLGIGADSRRAASAKFLQQIIASGMAPKEAGPSLPTGGASLADQTKAKTAKPDQTDTLTKAAEEDLQHALRGLAEAYKALTANIDARTRFETQAIDAEAAAEQAKLAADLKKLVNDKTIDGKISDILQAKIEQAQADVELARLAKNELVERNAARATLDQWFASQKEIAGYLDQVAAAAEASARTAKARTEIERTTLLAQQRLARQILKESLDREVADDPSRKSDAAVRLKSFDDAQSAQRQSFDLGHEDPIRKYIRSVQDLDTEFQNAGVSAAKSLASGLADAIVNAQNLGDVAKNVFRNLVSQLLAAVLERDVTGPLLALAGFADGTDYAPGGVALVGERGPELVNLPRGSRVTPNIPTMAALRGGAVSPRTGASGDVHLNVNVVAGGAIPREEIERMVRSGSLQAVQAARQLARSDRAQTQYDQSLNG